MAQQLSFTSVIESAAKLPLVHIDRTEFLTKNLSKLCTPSQLQKAIVEGTLHADIPIVTLDSLANAVINAETIKVTAISTAAGIPGGFAMPISTKILRSPPAPAASPFPAEKQPAALQKRGRRKSSYNSTNTNTKTQRFCGLSAAAANTRT